MDSFEDVLSPDKLFFKKHKIRVFTITTKSLMGMLTMKPKIVEKNMTKECAVEMESR